MMSRSNSAFIHGTTHFKADQREAKTYGKGRRCRVEECGALLSTYNPRDVCALHEGMPVKKTLRQAGLVDAYECREHILALMISGMTCREIAAAGVMSETIVRRVAYGQQDSVRLSTLNRVLKVRAKA